MFFDRISLGSVAMTAFTSVVNASSFLPSLYAFYNFTSVNNFATTTTNQSANGTTMTSSPEQTTNRTTEAAIFNSTEYDTTFVDVTNMTSSSTSSSSPSSFSSSSFSAFHSTGGGQTGSAHPDSFPFTADADFTTDFTSGYQSTHAQSVYASTMMMRVGSYGSEAVTAAVTTEVGSLQQLAGGHYYAAGIVVGTLAVLFILSAFGLLLCRRRLQTYHSLPSGSTRNYDYLYRPLNKAGRLNEEYDHTFVGVSIPLLQEVTIV